MPIIKPFRGIRYSPQVIGDLAQVVCPPYDVISPAQQEMYHQRHPHNVIRLILAKDQPGDDERRNRYTRAGECFRDWLQKGILVHDESPAIYVYEQEFPLGSQTRARRGFIARVRLEEFGDGQIYPHEQTMSGPKQDRLRLMESCHANLSQVFALYPEGDGSVSAALADATSRPPTVHFRDEHGTVNRLWMLKEDNGIRRLADGMRSRPLFIADGHHRYETALEYRRRHAGGDADAACNFIMMMCVSLADPGLCILPTHRLVRSRLRCATLCDGLKASFDLREMAGFPAADTIVESLGQAPGRHVFALVAHGAERWFVLTARDPVRLGGAGRGHCPAWQELDVSILHALVIEPSFGIPSTALSHHPDIAYVRDEGEALALVREGHFQFAFFLNPTQVGQVSQVASAGDKMPPKSTYFFPKLLTGLVISPLEGSSARA